MSLTLEFEAEEYAVDAILRDGDRIVLRFWLDSTRRIEIATNCCGAHASRTLQNGPLRCVKCKVKVENFPASLHAYDKTHETIIADWLTQLDFDVIEANVLATHIGLNVEALTEELHPLYADNTVETIEGEEALWARIAGIAHREKVLL